MKKAEKCKLSAFFINKLIINDLQSKLDSFKVIHPFLRRFF
jgi:hypothetical protein